MPQPGASIPNFRVQVEGRQSVRTSPVVFRQEGDRENSRHPQRLPGRHPRAFVTVGGMPWLKHPSDNRMRSLPMSTVLLDTLEMSVSVFCCQGGKLSQSATWRRSGSGKYLEISRNRELQSVLIKVQKLMNFLTESLNIPTRQSSLLWRTPTNPLSLGQRRPLELLG